MTERAITASNFLRIQDKIFKGRVGLRNNVENLPPITYNSQVLKIIRICNGGIIRAQDKNGRIRSFEGSESFIFDDPNK